MLLSADTEDVCIVERLFSSSLVAIVSLKAPRKLKVCHFKKGTEICNYSYSNTILAVRLNRQVSDALTWIRCRRRAGPRLLSSVGLVAVAVTPAPLRAFLVPPALRRLTSPHPT